MKKTASKKELVEQTVTRLEEAQAATQERIDAVFAILAQRQARYIGATCDTICRYLDHAKDDALEKAKHIKPNVADLKEHPLPAIKDLFVRAAEPRFAKNHDNTDFTYERNTLNDVVFEITDYLDHEFFAAVPGMMHGLREFLTWYQGAFLDALRRLTKEKIAVCDTLGNSSAKEKLLKAFASLPSFPSPESFEAYNRRILACDESDPTDEIVMAWRKHQPAPFPSPDKFADALRRALMLDAEATDEINANTAPATAEPTTTKKTERQWIVALAYQIYTSKEWQHKKLKGDKTPKDISYSRAIRVMLDEPIPQNDPFYEQTKEAREIVKRMAKGGDDAAIRNSLKTQVINYAKSIKPNTHKTLTIGQAVSRLSPSDKQTVRDALDFYGEDHYDHDGYMGACPTIGDSSAYR